MVALIVDPVMAVVERLVIDVLHAFNVLVAIVDDEVLIADMLEAFKVETAILKNEPVFP